MDIRLGPERLIALTDGVVAVVITIMVLELRPPESASAESLLHLFPTFLSYMLSFIYVAIFWNNHHHFFKLVPTVDGLITWANLNLLFWLSLIPFTTAWMDAHIGAAAPVALYGGSLLCSGLAWRLMQAAIFRHQGSSSVLRRALGADMKGRLSVLLYGAAIAAAFFVPTLAYVCYAVIAVVWLIPDRRIMIALESDIEGNERSGDRGREIADNA